MLKILQIDGGGIRGLIPAIILASLEHRVGKPCSQIFDIIQGTSTGAIIGGCLAAGVPADRVRQVYTAKGRELFSPRSKLLPWNLARPKYDREPFLRMITEQVGRMSMRELRTEFIATAFNLVSGRTHFIKSRDPKDGAFSVVDVISWSALSAAYYFGALQAPEYAWTQVQPDCSTLQCRGAVFQDGGQGVQNCTLAYAMFEAMARPEQARGGAYILSLGCGCHSDLLTFKDACNKGFIDQIKLYPGQARESSAIEQVLAAQYVALRRPEVRVERINPVLSEDQDELDAVKYLDDFQRIGLSLAASAEFAGL